jgi:GNAT superfamily N-acetyltransferase
LKIRRITSAEISAVLPLVEQYWIFEDIQGFDEAALRREFERVCSDPRLGAGWIAEDGGRAVGYLLAVYVHSLEHLGLTAEIDEFFLLPSARGHGAGVAMLDAAETEFRRMGCTNVSLQLGRGNEAARDFYQRRGYSERSGYELLDKMLRQ